MKRKQHSRRARYFSFLHRWRQVSLSLFLDSARRFQRNSWPFQGIAQRCRGCVRPHQKEKDGFFPSSLVCLFAYWAWVCLQVCVWVNFDINGLVTHLGAFSFYFYGDDVRDKNYKRPTSKSIKVHAHSKNTTPSNGCEVKYLSATCTCDQNKGYLWLSDVLSKSGLIFQIFLQLSDR